MRGRGEGVEEGVGEWGEGVGEWRKGWGGGG